MFSLYFKGNVVRVKELLEAGANANTKDFAGWTPLVSSFEIRMEIKKK